VQLVDGRVADGAPDEVLLLNGGRGGLEKLDWTMLLVSEGPRNRGAGSDCESFERRDAEAEDRLDATRLCVVEGLVIEGVRSGLVLLAVSGMRLEGDSLRIGRGGTAEFCLAADPEVLTLHPVVGLLAVDMETDDAFS